MVLPNRGLTSSYCAKDLSPQHGAKNKHNLRQKAGIHHYKVRESCRLHRQTQALWKNYHNRRYWSQPWRPKGKCSTDHSAQIAGPSTMGFHTAEDQRTLQIWKSRWYPLQGHMGSYQVLINKEAKRQCRSSDAFCCHTEEICCPRGWTHSFSS